MYSWVGLKGSQKEHQREAHCGGPHIVASLMSSSRVKPVTRAQHFSIGVLITSLAPWLGAVRRRTRASWRVDRVPRIFTKAGCASGSFLSFGFFWGLSFPRYLILSGIGGGGVAGGGALKSLGSHETVCGYQTDTREERRDMQVGGSEARSFGT